MSFALITGASKGIGRAIAFEFAKRGKDVLLVSRDGNLLSQTCTEIESSFKVKAHFYAADLSDQGSPNKILDWTEKNGYAIDVLVNNAGYGLSGPFENYPVDQLLNMMEVNMNAMVQLTWLFLPVLKKQQQGYIMNIGSSAGYQSTPFLSLYSATKAFVINFSRGLHIELKKTNVSVTCISPGTTATGFNDRANIGEKALKMAKKVEMPAEPVAKIAVDAMYKKKTEVIVGFLTKAGAFFAWLLPKKFIENTAAKIYQ